MIKRIVAKPVRRLLHQVGLELRPKRDPGELEPTLALQDPWDAIYQHGDVAFEVPLSHCMYPYLFSYGPQGWHPFVAVLKQYQDHPGLAYRDSVLHHYYERFHPKTVLDIFFSPEEQTPALQRSGFAQLAIPPHNPTFPWDPQHSLGEGEAGLDPSHGNQGYGPVSDAKGALEFGRLTTTLESVKLYGYQPAHGHDGDIRGYFVRSADDYRFVVRQGLHRTAVLAALGCESIRVKFFVPYPRAIYEHDLCNWPQVKSGVLEPEVARRMFRKFFENDGRERALRLGLLEAAPA